MTSISPEIDIIHVMCEELTFRKGDEIVMGREDSLQKRGP